MCSWAVQAQERVLLSDFGARTNSFENAAPSMKLALAACIELKASILVLPGGRINVWPKGSYKKELHISNCTESDTNSKERTIAFLLEGLDGFTLDGNNTLIVLHRKMLSYPIINSKNITVKDLAFNYERPTMSELAINDITDTAADVTLHPDSRYLLGNGRLVLYGEGWKTNAYHAILFDTVTATAVEEARGRIYFKGDFSKRNIRQVRCQAGDTLVEGSNLLAAAVWIKGTGSMVAYSRDGYTDKKWQLPSGYKHRKHASVYEVTQDGKQHLRTLPVKNGALVLSLGADQLLLLQQQQ